MVIVPGLMYHRHSPLPTQAESLLEGLCELGDGADSSLLDGGFGTADVVRGGTASSLVRPNV